jgi:hypothetical protein
MKADVLRVAHTYIDAVKRNDSSALPLHADFVETASQISSRYSNVFESYELPTMKTGAAALELDTIFGLAFHDNQVLPDGAIVEMKIWELAAPVTGSAHKLKYSLFYGVEGERLVGYDNERDKGDHRHIGDHQERYVFKTVQLLMADFLADVRRLRGER